MLMNVGFMIFDDDLWMVIVKFGESHYVNEEPVGAMIFAALNLNVYWGFSR